MRGCTRFGRAQGAGLKWLAGILAGVLLLPGCAGAGGAEGPGDAEAPAGASGPAVPFEPPAGNPVLDQIGLSYSAGEFVEGAVSAEDLEAILRSGAKAPSAKNAQPWHFTVITQADTVRQMHGQAADGTVLIVVSGREDLATDTMEFDCGLAAAYMQLAAESLGYGARILIYPVPALERDREDYGIPDGYEVLAAMAVGHTEVDGAATATPRNPLAGMVNHAGRE